MRNLIKYTKLALDNKKAFALQFDFDTVKTVIVRPSFDVIRLPTANKLIKDLNLVSIAGHRYGNMPVGSTIYIFPEFKHLY